MSSEHFPEIFKQDVQSGGHLVLDNISVVLVEPQIPENIGASARAMKNMGIKSLFLVRPKNCDLSRILKMATGNSIDIIEDMEIYDDFLEAIGGFQFIAGTTARTGTHRPAMVEPREFAIQLIPISLNNRIGILFGREDKGLTNEHLRYCHTIIKIPTSDFSSLNLAHSVMVICYEMFLASRLPSDKAYPRMANRFELEGMYSHLKDVLTKVGFINPQNPEHWMLNIRRMLSRFPIRARDVRIIRGICRQIDWYTEKVKNEAQKNKNENKT